MRDDRFGDGPVDRLIRELSSTRRDAQPEEIRRILRRVASAPFYRREVRVPVKYRGLSYRGRTVGDREDSLFLHLVQRVVDEEQWTDGTTEAQYLDDLRSAVRAPERQPVVYERRGGVLAGVFGPNALPESRKGANAKPYLLVVYSADRGRIISGYQVSGLDRTGIPEDAKWLER